MSELTNRMIAERRGLTVYEAGPQGYPAYVGRMEFADEWIIVDGESREIPDYLHSTDLALTLPLDGGYRFLLFGAAGDGWHCYIENEVGAIDDRIAGQHADVPAEAVCAAWWAWSEAQGV